MSQNYLDPSSPNGQPGQLFYRKSPLCLYCGQPIAEDGLLTSVRDSDGNDHPAHKQCVREVMDGVWSMLENEGEGSPMHYPHDASTYELPEEGVSQIRPYAVAPLDRLMPAASLNRKDDSKPQQVHKAVKLPY